jgi:hypothetical protein
MELDMDAGAETLILIDDDALIGIHALSSGVNLEIAQSDSGPHPVAHLAAAP